MEYTNYEKHTLSLMERTNFKNLSKNDVISFVSKLEQMRPDVAKEVLAQYPEFTSLMKSVLTEYNQMLNSIISSDDLSIGEYYAIAQKGMDSAVDSRTQFYSIVKQVQADCSKLLDNPNLSPEMIMGILNREKELIQLLDEKDKEIRQQEREIEEEVRKKDSEKREFNLRLIKTISVSLVYVVGISAGLLGGNYALKLPQN